MLKNYLKIALRSFWHDKGFSILNLLGLSIGLAAVIMIMAYVRHELSYDRHYSNSPNVYRILEKRKTGAGEELNLNVSAGTARALQRELPGIKEFSYVNQWGYNRFKIQNDFIPLNSLEASANFFKIFNLPFIAGDPETCLQHKMSMVITEKTAKTFFPGINPIGKYITSMYGEHPITAVIKVPSNMHLQFDALISNVGDRYTKATGSRTELPGAPVPQYLLLEEGADPESLARKFSAIYEKYGWFSDVTFHLQPVRDIHLHSNLIDELYPNGDIRYVYIFSSAGLLILLIAIINYINMSIARSIRRTKEIGVRKVMGAMRTQLIFQFLFESFLFFTAALTISIFLSWVFWPVFLEKISTGGALVPLFDGNSFFILAYISLAGGLLSGLYPALYLSYIKPALSLKGFLKYDTGISLRKALVIFQFAIVGILVIATLVVQRQLYFISTVRLGFNKENLVILPSHFYSDRLPAFKNELIKNPAISSVSLSDWQPGEKFGGPGVISSSPEHNAKILNIQYLWIDPVFIKTAGIEILQGRDYSGKDRPYIIDSYTSQLEQTSHAVRKRAPILINETAVKLMGLKDPIGKTYGDENDHVTGTVIGIVKDFNASTLHQKIPALVLKFSPDEQTGYLLIRISSKNMPATLRFIEKEWKQFYPDDFYDFSFVEDNLQKLYASEQKLGALFGIFSSLAILIACVGLFGLVSLNVQQRVKEIGIRKVLGASVSSIVSLLSSDFLKLVLLAIVIASPISWWLMNRWLQDFAYRINIEWWVFAVTGLITILIAFVTVSLQSVKAARANPVNSLRSE